MTENTRHCPPHDLAPAESLPVPFHGLSCAELDPARFVAIGLSKDEQASICGLVTSVNHTISGLKKLADFLPPDLSFEPMRDNLLQVCNRMRRIVYCTDPVGYMLCDIEDYLMKVRNNLIDLNVRLKGRHIENPSIDEAVKQIDEGLNFSCDHLAELDDVMS